MICFRCKHEGKRFRLVRVGEHHEVVCEKCVKEITAKKKEKAA